MDETVVASTTEPKKVSTLAVLVVLVVACLGIGWACSALGSDPPSQGEAGQAGCQEMAAAVSDLRAGILTDDEFRDRVKSAYADARFSDDAAVRDAATRVLASITQGSATLTDDLVSMGNACSAAS